VSARTAGPRTVLVNAGPWLPVPPPGYGGIENVVATLVPELRARGVRVVLASVGSSTLEADERLATFQTGQFAHLAGPYSMMSGIAHAHLQAVVARLRAGGVDLVHDHVEVVGPAVLAAMGQSAPPTLQTLHWDLGKHPHFYRSFDGGGRVMFCGVSATQLATAPPRLRDQAVGYVPLATPIPSTPPATADRGDYVLTLGRITRYKGQHVAAQVCARLGLPLRLAGPVAGADTPAELERGLTAPEGTYRGNADVRYFLDEVRPHVDGRLVRWLGTVGGQDKADLLRRARALLFPVDWEEPGATAVVESLAAGTPVVATRRGVLPSLIEHGVTGFLADSVDELAGYLRRVDELDPDACRRVAVERFSPAAMAEGYLSMYEQVLHRAR